jgi:hypothetical protein
VSSLRLQGLPAGRQAGNLLRLPFGLKNGLFQKGSANIEVARKLSQADAK